MMRTHAVRPLLWAVLLVIVLGYPRSACPDEPIKDTDRYITLIPYAAAGYKYKIGPHDHSPGFHDVDYDDVFFATGPAPFGRGPAPGRCPLDTSVRTSWPINTDLVVRRSFYLPMQPKRIWIEAAIDNDIQIFINGVGLDANLTRFSGCAHHGQYYREIPVKFLKIGSNTLAIRARDRGVDSYLDIKLSAELEWI